jgi:site-specific recombinase XerD
VYSEGSLAIHAHGVAVAGGQRLFDLSRQQWHRRLGKACEAVGIPQAKRHWHSLRHSTAMSVFRRTVSLGAVKQALRHKSWSAALVYLNESDSGKAFDAIRSCFDEMSAAAQLA